MKYLFILFFALTSNLSFASYHGGDTTTPAYDEGGGGYSSGGSAAAAIIGLGVLGYYLLNNNSDEEEQEFSNEQTLNNFEINFVKDGSSFDSSDENFGYQNDFQVNFKYYLN